MMQHGPWKIVRSHQVHQDPWVRVRQDEVVRPDGKPGTYTLVHLKPGVSVLAMDEQQHVYLTEEFHYGVGRITLETVSGGRDSNEDALTTAQRELEEELGIRARQWKDMGSIDPFTANVVSPTQLFLAQGLEFCESAPEGTEVIRCVKMTLAEATELAITSRITHGPSVALILKTHLWTARVR